MSRSISGGSALSLEMKRSNSRFTCAGIDGRDAEAVTNHRIGRRAASLAKDPFFAAEFNDLSHGQEVAWIIERLDDLEFFLQLIRDVRRYPAAVALTGALESEMAQPIRGCRSVGHMLRGIAITDFSQRKTAAVGNLLRANDGRRIVGKKSGKSIGVSGENALRWP